MQEHSGARDRYTEVRHDEAGEAKAHEAGAVDEVVESNTHSERQGHSDLLKLSSPETDVAQQVVRHSSAPFQ